MRNEAINYEEVGRATKQPLYIPLVSSLLLLPYIK